MKLKVIITIAFIINASYGWAQIEKGKYQFGGALGYSKSNLEDRPLLATDYEKKDLLLLPSIGYFFSANQALGLGFGYNNARIYVKEQRVNTKVARRAETELWIINPYYRIHKKISESFVFFLEGSFLFGLGSTDLESEEALFHFGLSSGEIIQSQIKGSTIQLDNSFYSLNISPGLVFFPTKNIGIDLSFGILGYSQMSSHNEFRKDRERAINFFTRLSNPNIGIKFYL